MDAPTSQKSMTRQNAAKRVEIAIIVATASVLAADALGWPAVPFFALWSVGWTIIHWMLLPEA